MLRHYGRAASVLLFTTLLIGCAQISPKMTGSAQALNAQQVAKIMTWQVTGRFAYRDTVTHNGFTAAILLDQHNLRPKQTQLMIVGPLSLWRATFNATDQEATLALSDGRVFHATSIDALLRANVAWYLPVAALNYWLFALPEPGSHAKINRNTAGEMTEMLQAGWAINYSEYQWVDGYRLPKRLILTKGPLQLKLAIEQWNIKL